MSSALNEVALEVRTLIIAFGLGVCHTLDCLLELSEAFVGSTNPANLLQWHFESVLSNNSRVSRQDICKIYANLPSCAFTICGYLEYFCPARTVVCLSADFSNF